MKRSALTLLYVPGDRPDRVAKALASEADVVILDLEDAVAPAGKDAARAAVRSLATVERPVQVRINDVSSRWHSGDLAALAGLPASVAVRVPKVETPEEVRLLAQALPGHDLHLLLESAVGVERAFVLATAHDQVASIGLGESDLRSDLRLVDDAGLTWARGRVVVAARAAGLPPPSMSVYPNVKDAAGLTASCLAGRALGFLGRAAVHPAQLGPIRAAFLPDSEEVARARAVVDRVAVARAGGLGAIALEDGTFLDVAMVEQARAVVELTESD